MSSFPTTQWRVEVDGETTSAIYQRGVGSETGAEVLFVCAHGAGGSLSDRGTTRLAEGLVERGISVVRYNFLYREKGSRRPDPMPSLERCVAAVTEHARKELAPVKLVMGGRSMGGRASSMLAAKGFSCDGLLLVAYPLHPAGKPDQLRDSHLPDIRVPVLCLNGTRDTLCRRDLMESVLKRVGSNWTMHWLEGADHMLHVLKSSGRTDAEVQREMLDTAASWVGEQRGAGG